MAVGRAVWSNWAGNLHYGGRLVEPASVDEVVAHVRAASRVQVVGSGHSFIHPSGPASPLVSGAPAGAGEELLVLDLTKRMGRVLNVDEAGWSCTVEGGCTFETLARALGARGLALENMPSLHVVTVAGAVLTATHGCGRHRACLAELVRSMTIVGGDGCVREVTDPRLFVHFGLLGVVVRLTLRCVPFYRVAQRCYDGVPLPAFLDRCVDVVKSAAHTQFWVDFRGGPGGQGKVLGWLRERCGHAEAQPPPEMFPGSGGSLRYEPIPLGESPEWPIHATGSGPWYDMLAFFRLGATLPVASSVQVEFFVPLAALPAALRALAAAPGLAPLMSHGCEVRPVAADGFAMSPCHVRFSEGGASERLFAGLHFTLDLDPSGERIVAAVQEIEKALTPFGLRPHWGKLFHKSPELLARSYGPERHGDCATFWATALEWDPAAKFRDSIFDALARSAPVARL